jgi:hypothetical protein
MNPVYLDAVRSAVKATSRSDVAKQIGVDSSDLGKVLNGAKQPSVAMQSKIVTWVDGQGEKTATVTDDAGKPKRPNKAKAAAEKKALDAWMKGGKKGSRPETPNLDAVKEDAAKPPAAEKRAAKSNGSKRRPVAEGIVFYHDGKPMPASQNKLSSVAWSFTKGVVDGKDRLSTTELVDYLKSKGVAEPANSAWSVELPNGITLSATV